MSLTEEMEEFEKRIERTDSIVIRMKSGSQEIEKEMGTRNLIRLIMDYLGIVVEDKEYLIVNKEKKGE